jgi:opacity protein-like surface antigen
VDFTTDLDGSTISGKIKLRDISIMAGPRFTVRKNERVTPFIHGLAGFDHWRLSGEATVDGQSVPSGASETSSGFGIAVGGGLDVKVNKSMAIRLFQADYFLTRHESNNWNNINLAFGVVFRFGK